MQHEGAEPDPDLPEHGALRRVPWGVAEAFLLILAVYLLAWLWSAARVVLEEAGTIGPDALDRWALPLVFLLMGAPPVLWVGLRYREGLRRLVGRIGGRPLRVVGIGLALGVVMFVLTRLVLALLLLLAGGGELPDLPQVQQEYQDLAVDPALSLWFLVTVVAIAPVAEEILFRGVVYQALRDRVGRWPGIGLSSVVFTLLHLTQPTLDANLLIFVLIFPLAMFLAWVFERYGTLVLPIAVHAAYNLVGVVLFRIGASGMPG